MGQIELGNSWLEEDLIFYVSTDARLYYEGHWSFDPVAIMGHILPQCVFFFASGKGFFDTYMIENTFTLRNKIQFDQHFFTDKILYCKGQIHKNNRLAF